jgi:transcriptional regulator with XRE-family HTH domain
MILSKDGGIHMNENQTPFHLCKKITELRKENGYTQEILANKLGITYQAISKWENELSYPDITLLSKIADIFKISLDELFGRVTTAVTVPDNNNPKYYSNELPWEDDDTLRIVLFRGKHYIQTKDSNEIEHIRDFKFIYEGDALNISSDFSVECSNCDIAGDVTAAANVFCGDVEGYVSSGGYINCGDIDGNVTSGGSVNCGDIDGNVSTGCSVSCGDINGNVSAGSNITCADIDGDVTAGGNISCGDIDGNVECQGSIKCSSY